MKEMKKAEIKNKKKNSGLTSIFLLATTIVVAAAVYATIKEGRRVKEENKLLAYEVW